MEQPRKLLANGGEVQGQPDDTLEDFRARFTAETRMREFLEKSRIAALRILRDERINENERIAHAVAILSSLSDPYEETLQTTGDFLTDLSYSDQETVYGSVPTSAQRKNVLSGKKPSKPNGDAHVQSAPPEAWRGLLQADSGSSTSGSSTANQPPPTPNNGRSGTPSTEPLSRPKVVHVQVNMGTFSGQSSSRSPVVRLGTPSAAQSSSRSPVVRLGAYSAAQSSSHSPVVRLGTPSAAQSSSRSPVVRLGTPSATQSSSHSPVVRLGTYSAAQSSSRPDGPSVSAVEATSGTNAGFKSTVTAAVNGNGHPEATTHISPHWPNHRFCLQLVGRKPELCGYCKERIWSLDPVRKCRGCGMTVHHNLCEHEGLCPGSQY